MAAPRAPTRQNAGNTAVPRELEALAGAATYADSARDARVARGLSTGRRLSTPPRIEPSPPARAAVQKLARPHARRARGESSGPRRRPASDREARAPAPHLPCQRLARGRFPAPAAPHEPSTHSPTTSSSLAHRDIAAHVAQLPNPLATCAGPARRTSPPSPVRARVSANRGPSPPAFAPPPAHPSGSAIARFVCPPRHRAAAYGGLSQGLGRAPPARPPSLFTAGAGRRRAKRGPYASPRPSPAHPPPVPARSSADGCSRGRWRSERTSRRATSARELGVGGGRRRRRRRHRRARGQRLPWTATAAGAACAGPRRLSPQPPRRDHARRLKRRLRLCAPARGVRGTRRGSRPRRARARPPLGLRSAPPARSRPRARRPSRNRRAAAHLARRDLT